MKVMDDFAQISPNLFISYLILSLNFQKNRTHRKKGTAKNRTRDEHKGGRFSMKLQGKKRAALIF